MDQLFLIDQRVFFFINHLPHPAWGNLFAESLSGVGTAGVIWFFLALFLFFKEEKKNHWFVVSAVIAGVGSLFLSEEIAKPLIGRVRPTIDMGAIVVGLPLRDASFPSGHATMAWAMAVVLSRKEPKLRWIFYVLAVFISLSRIYLGKHYPSDVFAGALLGWGIGRISLALAQHIQKTRRRKLREYSR